MRTVPCLLAVTFSLGLSAQASAAGPGEAVAYRAPAACPSEDGFVQRLGARLGASQSAGGGGRSLAVQIVVTSGRYIGKLSIIEADGRSTTKVLSDDRCEALVDALSLVAALALETDAIERSAPTAPTPAPAPSTPAPAPSTPSPAPSSPTPAPAPASTPTPAPAPASTPAPAPAPAPAPPLASAPASAPAPAPAPEGSSRLGLAIGALATVGPAPNPLFGATLSLHWAGLGTGAFNPTLELGGAASLSPDAPESRGTASFAWLTAHAVAYLVAWPLGVGVVVRGGLAGDFGLLIARGRDTSSPATSSRPWGALGGVLGVEVPLAHRLAIQPAVAVEAPLRRDRYAFGSTDFFEVPVVVATGGVSVVAYFEPGNASTSETVSLHAALSQ